jgi:hypothetical protein
MMKGGGIDSEVRKWGNGKQVFRATDVLVEVRESALLGVFNGDALGFDISKHVIA